ncbi:unnamed protein product [[Candida] boidinii]|nr:unnamed protein product [[Candida] boidinii]
MTEELSTVLAADFMAQASSSNLAADPSVLFFKEPSAELNKPFEAGIVAAVFLPNFASICLETLKISPSLKPKVLINEGVISSKTLSSICSLAKFLA